MGANCAVIEVTYIYMVFLVNCELYLVNIKGIDINGCETKCEAYLKIYRLDDLKSPSCRMHLCPSLLAQSKVCEIP